MDITIPDFDEITEDGRRLMLERTIKSNGIWRVHKSDADTIFPSNFHAVNIETGEKLDLYTGEVFNPVSKQLTRKLPKKAMRYVYGELQSCEESEITGKCQNRASFTFL